MRKAQALRNARALRDSAAATPRFAVVRHHQSFAERLLADAERDQASGRSLPSPGEIKFSERIDNWQRAHRWFRSLGRSRSLEGYYRPPRGVEVEYETGDPPPKPPQMVDIHDAWLLELSWRSLHFKARFLLQCNYHKPIQPAKACRLLRSGRLTGTPIFIRPEDWDYHCRGAVQDLRDEVIRRVSNKETEKLPVPVDFQVWRAYKREQDLLESLAD